MCMGCTCSSSGQTWRTSQAFACCVSSKDVGMLQVKKWKHIKGIVQLSRYNPNSLAWGRDTMRKDEGGMKALRVFLCGVNIECWAVFHLNLGSILCGILIMLPLVWIGLPSQLTFSWAYPAHLHTLLNCEMSAKRRMINSHWPLDDKCPTLKIPSQSAHQVIIQHSPQPYEKRFGWPQYSLKMVFWKELINKQTILELLTSWGQQHCHGR